MNKAILMGRLVRNPELRQTPNGTSVVSFTIAVDRRFKSANGERETDFIPVTAWRQLADFVAKYFRQGSKICIVGSIQVRPYEKNGERRSYTEVVADEAYFAETKQSTSSDFAYNSDNSAEPSNFTKPTNTAFNIDDSDEFFNTTGSDDDVLPFSL